ncbi:MAG: hypothetical protein J4N89_12580, partial [Chloroflexi bacterium]|nr:hypothetical protein [Chloroflexota bacterium]
CNEALTVASIVGREFTMAQLRPLVEEVTEDRLFEILEEALASRVIEELPQTVSRYQFTHALIQETLAEELSITRRVRLHARIAETLEDLYGDDADSHAAELAHHFAEAEAVIGTEKLVHYSLVAGERASAAYAWQEAQGHFERGLIARGVPLAGAEPAPDSQAAALLFGYGRALTGTLQRHQFQEAVDSLARAFDYYVEAGDTSRAVAIAQNPHSADLMSGMREIISRAVQLAPADSLESGRVLASHGYCLGMTVEGYESAQNAFDQALTIARTHNDRGLEMRVLANSANIDGFDMRWETCLANSLQALELANSVDDSYSKLRANLWAFWALLYANGDIEGARPHAEEIRSMAEKLRDALWLSRAFQIETELSYLAGAWSSARQFSDQGIALFPTNPVLLEQRAMIEYQVGNVTQGDSYLQRFLVCRHSNPIGIAEYSTSLFLAQISRITGNDDLLDIVQDEAQILSDSSTMGLGVFREQCGLALVAAQQGDGSQSGELYTALAPQRGTLVTRAGALSVDRLLGLLSQTMGNLEGAVAHFEDALAFCRNAGFRPELAWICCDYADALRERDGEGDLAKATSLLDESLAISSDLGMRPLMERVLSRRGILGA